MKDFTVFCPFRKDRDIENLLAGFEQLDIKVEMRPEDAEECSGVPMLISGVRQVQEYLRCRGVEWCGLDCYPSELVESEFIDFLGRKVTRTTIEGAASMLPCFIKPAHSKDEVDAGVYQDNKDDREALGWAAVHRGVDHPVYVSEIVEFLSEWRVFVIGGEAVWAACYRGDYRKAPDWHYVDLMIRDFVSAPASYCLDVGQMKKAFGKMGDLQISGDVTALIEVNDGICFGGYGIPPALHARMWIARWKELTASAGPARRCADCKWSRVTICVCPAHHPEWVSFSIGDDSACEYFTRKEEA